MGRRLTSPTMVGRASESALLDALLAESASGSRCAIITGETGIGKTRLLSALITVAAERGIPAFVGGCPVAVGATVIPFAAVTQALRSMVRSMDARGLDRRLGSARAELARLLPELGAPGEEGPATGPQDVGRLFEAVLLLVEQVASSGGALLVLEDLHWADPPTWALVAHLHRNLGSAPVLMAISFREHAATTDLAREATAELMRDASVGWIRLEPLSRDDSSALLQGLPELALSEHDRATILRRAEGIPFYLEELADQAVALAPSVLPISVRAAVEARSSRLTPGCRLLVDLVATSDGPVDVRLLRRAAGTSDAGLADALQEAMAEHLLVGAGPQDQLVDTRHTLIREALVAALVPGQAARLHLLLADATEAHLAWAGESDLERWHRLANHRQAAGERERAIPALVHVAQAARQALAFADADDAYGQVLGMVGDGPPPLADGPWRELLADAAAVARLAGSADRAVMLQERAIGWPGGGADDWQTMARIRLARYRAEAGQPHAAEALLREVAATAPPGMRARCALELARVLLAVHDHAGAIEYAQVARRTAREMDDLREEARAAAALGVALSMAGRHEEALAALAASRSGDLDDEGRPAHLSRPSRLPDSLLRHVDRAIVLSLAGDPQGASHAALDGSETARRSGIAGSWAAVLAALAGRELMRVGRWDEARAALGDSVDGDPRGAAPTLVVLAFLSVRRGDLDAADAALVRVDRAALGLVPGAGWVALHAMAIVELALARAGSGAARIAVAEGLAGSDGDPDTLLRVELACLGLRVEADAASEARARRDVAAVAEAEANGLSLFATARSESAGPSAAGLASWLAALGGRLEAERTRLHRERAEGAWEAAVTRADGTPDPFWQAYARYRLAEAMLDEGMDRASAAPVLQDCVRLAGRLGAAPLVEDARRLAVRARISLDLAVVVREPSGSTAPRRSARELGLSEREVDVLELLALGMTDREIGARLFITEKTAGHHVSHILTKLTVARRGEAAALAHRLGVVGPGA
jgi:DNA-binding CsgD family transcriptional regulator/tetratricopeptide (TPR) repeat protein